MTKKSNRKSTVFLKTHRMRFRSVTRQDFKILSTLFGDPELMKHLGGARSKKQIEDILKWMLDHWKQHAYGPCVVELKKTSKEVGICGIKKMVIEGRDLDDLGFP